MSKLENQKGVCILDNKFLSILESIIPGKIPKVISGLTIVITLVLLKYSPFLPFVSSPLTKLEEAALRLIPALLSLLAGGTFLTASLVYEINKVNEDKIKTQRAARSLHKALHTLTRLIPGEKKRLQARFSILQSKDVTTYTKDTVAEINSLNASGHFLENVSATILRYIDSDEAQDQPVVPASVERRTTD